MRSGAQEELRLPGGTSARVRSPELRLVQSLEGPEVCSARQLRGRLLDLPLVGLGPLEVRCPQRAKPQSKRERRQALRPRVR